MNRTTTPLTATRLASENRRHAHTCGVSRNARRLNLIPAFLDPHTGRIEIARFACGLPAPMHVIEGLPAEWATRFDEDGQITELKARIISGFVRDGIFYTREQAAALA